MDNCRVKVICEVSDPQSAKAVQDWCGKYREKKETLSAGKNRHKTYTYEDKDIVQPNDLITLVNQEEVILIISGVGYLRPKKMLLFQRFSNIQTGPKGQKPQYNRYTINLIFI